MTANSSLTAVTYISPDTEWPVERFVPRLRAAFDVVPGIESAGMGG